MVATGRWVEVRAPIRLDEWAAADELRRSLREQWADERVAGVRVNMRDVQAIGVVGFGKLLLYHHRMKQRGGALVVTSLPEEIRRVFTLLRLDAVLDIVD